MSKDKHIYIPLENVDSEHCALIVDKGLKDIEEIDEISVEINNKRVKISSEDLDEAIPLAVQKIRDLGYGVPTRSEEHTSELQSRGHLVCRLLLEKKKTQLKKREGSRREEQSTHRKPAEPSAEN